MLLRASGTSQHPDLDVSAVASEHGQGSGVTHGDVLIGLVDAVMRGDESARAATRAALDAAAGPAVVVDTAAVIAAFAVQNRVADALGLPLGAGVEMASRDVRAELGADRFSAASYTARGGSVRALLARVVAPLARLGLRVAGRMHQRSR